MAFALPIPRNPEVHKHLERVAQILTGPLGALCLALTLAMLCGIFVESRSLALAAALLLLLLLGLGYPTLAVRVISGSVTFTHPRLREGESLSLSMELVNRSWIPLWGLRIQGITSEEEEDGELLTLHGRERRTVIQTRSVLQRGRYPRATPQVACSFPFGLHTACRALRCTQEALVWPSYFPAPEIPESGSEERHEGTIPSRKAGTSGDLMGVRDFRRGDSLRRIHWAQTARHERLIVTERQALRLPHVQVILDIDGAVPGPDQEREWAIRAAMSLIEGWSSRGLRLDILIRDQGTRRLMGGLNSLRDALARLPRQGEGVSCPPVDVRLGRQASVTVLITRRGSTRRLPADLVIYAEAGGVRYD
jgi:uncharacterized protein (DUF58 family)